MKTVRVFANAVYLRHIGQRWLACGSNSLNCALNYTTSPG
jgi:hypothetical protein